VALCKLRGRIMDVTIFSPAKINLSLAVTGRRADGFHDLVSVVAPVQWGDELVVQGASQSGLSTLECDVPGVPTDGSNLILRAAEAFAAATGKRGAVRFKLTKRIPLGAGLGGGSSNAVAALRALNQLAGAPLSTTQLANLAAQLGSDCALFLHGGPVIMRGRGERTEALPAAASARQRGRRVLLFKPSFGISTPWAYGRMVARGTDYLPAEEAERRLSAWIHSDAPAEELLANNMEPAAFEKYLALPVLLTRLRREDNVAARMSGSGSACFALLEEEQNEHALIDKIRAAWGETAWVQVTRIA
jgi:4-diphosphocytidyl-2-C-methyl-D-erythritol kinase